MAEGESVGNSTRQAYEELEAFAERSRRADEQTALVAGLPHALERAVIYLVIAALAITLAILYFGRVQTVVETKGTIQPQGNVVTLQAGQSGVVTGVSAALGDYLQAGAIVLRVDASDAGLALAQAKLAREADEEQLRMLRASRDWLARVRERPDQHLSTPGTGALTTSTYDVLNRLEDARIQLDAAEAKQALVPERRQKLQGQMTVAEARQALLEQSLTDSKQALAAEEDAFGRKREELANVRKLADNKLLSVVELNAAEERFRAGETALNTARQRVGQAQVDIGTVRLEIADLGTSLRTLENDSRVEASTARARYDQALAGLLHEHDTTVAKVRELESKVAQSSRQVSIGEGKVGLAAVTMPVSGTIAELKVRNVGEIVSAGSQIATIVPSGVPLMVEASATNEDIGFVRPGVEARIKVDAFPFQQFGTARARVSKVLPGVGTNSSFVVHLDLFDQALRVDGAEHRLFPGLTVQADLVTGRERLIDVLLHGRSRGAPAPK
jgi:multidrug resistance efflux pump